MSLYLKLSDPEMNSLDVDVEKGQDQLVGQIYFIVNQDVVRLNKL